MTKSLLCISASCLVFSSFFLFFFSSDREKKAVLAKLLPSAHSHGDVLYYVCCVHTKR